jgi:hypothetical protein
MIFCIRPNDAIVKFRLPCMFQARCSVPLHVGRAHALGMPHQIVGGTPPSIVVPFCRPKTNPKSPPPGYSGGRLFRNIPRSAAFRIAKAILNLPVGLTRLIIGRYYRPHTARSASENGCAILWSALAGPPRKAVQFLALFSFVFL